MKSVYIVTKNGYPLTTVALTNDYLVTEMKEDEMPILFPTREMANKLVVALVWLDDIEFTWEYGVEKIYV